MSDTEAMIPRLLKLVAQLAVEACWVAFLYVVWSLCKSRATLAIGRFLWKLYVRYGKE